MKLLIYSHFFAPSIGGVETIVLSLARGIAELRNERGLAEFDVTLATQTPAGNHDDSSLPFGVVRGPRLGKLLQLIRESDVVHAAGPATAPLLLASLARKPLIIEHHGYQATCPNGLLFQHPSETVCPGHFLAGNYLQCLKCNAHPEGPIKSSWLLLSAFLRNALSRRANANIAPSHHVAARQSLPRTEVIFHGVEDPFTGKRVPPKRAFNAKRFAYLGRLVVEKGVSVLLKATHLLRAEGREVDVTLIGDGPDRPRLEKEISALGLETTVRITGYLTGARLAEAFRNTSVIVMPSAWEETAGLAAMEQMMRGRLVIASKIGGLAELVEGTGLVFPPGNAQALAECMQMVLQDPSVIDSLGQKARDRALRYFLEERMIEDHVRVYREAFERGNQRFPQRPRRRGPAQNGRASLL